MSDRPEYILPSPVDDEKECDSGGTIDANGRIIANKPLVKQRRRRSDSVEYSDSVSSCDSGNPNDSVDARDVDGPLWEEVPVGTRFRCRNMVFTYQGTHDDLNIDKSSDSPIKYIIWGREICPTTGNKHLQGYVQYKKQVHTKSVMKSLGLDTKDKQKKLWKALQKGTSGQCISYCSKEDPEPFQWGSYKMKSGRKGKGDSDAKKAIDKHTEITSLLKASMTDEALNDSWDDWMEKNTAIYSCNRIIAKELWESRQKRKTNTALRGWSDSVQLNEVQQEIDRRIEEQDTRQVTYVYDSVGNSGKSYYSKYKIGQGDCIRFTNAKTADVAYAYNGEGLVIFDLSRSIQGRVNYGVIEDLKNGMLFCGKYKSQSKIYPNPPKILILANFPPDRKALSHDRWDVYTVTNPVRIASNHSLVRSNVEHRKCTNQEWDLYEELRGDE